MNYGENFQVQDCNLLIVLELIGRQVPDEHIISSSPFTHRRPFIFLLFALGGKEQSVPPISWHIALCLVDTRVLI